MLTTRARLAALALLLGPGCDPGVGVGPRPGGSGGSGGGPVEKLDPGGSGGAALPERSCSDGLDDDGDGAVDCADPDCTPDGLLAKDVADTVTTWVPGTGESALVLYTATGTVGSKRRVRALPIEGSAAAGEAKVVYEGRSAWVEAMARPDGGYVAVFGRKDTGLIELAVIGDDGAVASRAVLAEGDVARPLVSAAIDAATGAVAVLRSVAQLKMELGWFDEEGTELQPWRTINVLEFYTARLVQDGGKVYLLILPNHGDDAIPGQFWAIGPKPGYRIRDLPELRAHPVPLVPRDGELMFHAQGVDAISSGGANDGPELVRIALNGTELDRREVPQPDGALRACTYVGAWTEGVAAVYPGIVDGAEGLLVVRASADLATLEGPAPLMPGLPTIVHLESTPAEDRIFYVSEDGRELRVKVVPRHCR